MDKYFRVTPVAEWSLTGAFQSLNGSTAVNNDLLFKKLKEIINKSKVKSCIEKAIVLLQQLKDLNNGTKTFFPTASSSATRAPSAPPVLHVDNITNTFHGQQQIFAAQANVTSELPSSQQLPVETKLSTNASRSPQLSPPPVLQGAEERNIQEPTMIDLTFDSDEEDEGDNEDQEIFYEDDDGTYDLLLHDDSYSTVDGNTRRKTKDVYVPEYPETLPTIRNNNHRWIVKNKEGVEVDLTTKLLDYRSHSIKENKKNYKSITPIRALTLDCVYLISIDDSITPFTNEDVELKFERNKGFISLPDYTIPWAKNILKVKQNEETNEWDVTETILSYQSIATKNQDRFALDYSRCLNDSIFTTLAPSNMKCNEDTLVHNSLHSPLNWLFGCDNRFQCNWANTSLSYCKGKKQGCLQPDFTAYFNEYRKQFDIFVVEVKKPGYPEGSDLIKLGYMMRKMLLELINERVEDPVVFGMIVSGFQCSTYRMEIQSAYLFKLIEMRKFNLPSHYHEIPCLDAVVESLYQVKALALDMRERLKNHFEKKKNKERSSSIVPMEFLPRSVSEDNVYQTQKNLLSSTSASTADREEVLLSVPPQQPPSDTTTTKTTTVIPRVKKVIKNKREDVGESSNKKLRHT